MEEALTSHMATLTGNVKFLDIFKNNKKNSAAIIKSRFGFFVFLIFHLGSGSVTIFCIFMFDSKIDFPSQME